MSNGDEDSEITSHAEFDGIFPELYYEDASADDKSPSKETAPPNVKTSKRKRRSDIIANLHEALCMVRRNQSKCFASDARASDAVEKEKQHERDMLMLKSKFKVGKKCKCSGLVRCRIIGKSVISILESRN